MRHRKHRGSLGLVSGHRRALLANLATALFTHGRIETTQAKARAMRPYVERLITLGKRGDLHARRQALAKLRYRPIVDKLFVEVAPQFTNRAGGYTRIIKTRQRVGDAAPMAMIELVDRAEVAGSEKKAASEPKAKKAAATEKKTAAKGEAEGKPKAKGKAKKET